MMVHVALADVLEVQRGVCLVAARSRILAPTNVWTLPKVNMLLALEAERSKIGADHLHSAVQWVRIWRY